MGNPARQYELDDINRRIGNIVAAYPQSEWTADEARAVLAVVSGIARVRQGAGDVDLRVAVTLTKPTGELVDELAVWQLTRRSDDLDNTGNLVRFEISGRDESFDRALA